MYLCILVLRTKIKSERFVFLPQFSRLRMEFYPLPVDNFSVLGRPGLRDCNNEPGSGIERELVTGNSSASEGFPATQQSADPGRNR